MPITSLEELLLEEIKDLYDAEKQITKALPKLIKAASSSTLKEAFTQHLEQTKNQVTRLEQVFENLGAKPKSKPCLAMKGLVEEGQEQTQEDAEGPLKDLMLIASAQKVEHYEISGYGTVRTLAETLGNQQVADLLRTTEEEESETDQKLTEIAAELLEEANAASDEEAEDEEEEVAPAKATKTKTATKKR